MPTDYWTGQRAAVLERDHIDAPWATGDGSSRRIHIVNSAFSLYYTARCNLNAFDSGTRADAAWKLAEAARSGWGWTSNPGDLEQAFEHLEANHGRWISNRTWDYQSSEGDVVSYGAIVTRVPESIVNFIYAVNARARTFSSLVRDFQDIVQRAVDAHQGEDWEVLGQVLNDCNTLLDRLMPHLWFVPQCIQSRRQGMVTFVSALSSVQSGISSWASAGGASPRVNAATSAGIGLMVTAVRFLPILGDLYGQALEVAPRLVAAVREDVTRRYGRIDDVLAGARH